MIITAKDGKNGFKTIEECLAYEAELDRKERKAKEKREKLQAEKKNRYEELKSLYKELREKELSYQRDYGEQIYIPNIIYNLLDI